MYFNRHQSIKTSEKKILRKVKKNWVVLSLSFLTVLGTGSLISKHDVAHADVVANNSSSVANSSSESASSQNPSLESQANDRSNVNTSEASKIDTTIVSSNYSSFANSSDTDVKGDFSTSDNSIDSETSNSNEPSSNANSSINSNNSNSQSSFSSANNNDKTVTVESQGNSLNADSLTTSNNSQNFSPRSDVNTNPSYNNKSLFLDLRVASPENNASNGNQTNNDVFYLTPNLPQSTLKLINIKDQYLTTSFIYQSGYPQYAYIQCISFNGAGNIGNDFQVVKSSNGNPNEVFQPKPGDTSWYQTDDGAYEVDSSHLYNSNGVSLKDNQITSYNQIYNFPSSVSQALYSRITTTLMSVPVIQIKYVDSSNGDQLSEQYVDSDKGAINSGVNFSTKLVAPEGYNFDSNNQPKTTSNYQRSLDNTYFNNNVPMATYSDVDVDNNDSKLSVTNVNGNNAVLNGTFNKIKTDPVYGSYKTPIDNDDWAHNIITIPVTKNLSPSNGDNNSPKDSNVLFTHFTYRRIINLVDYNTTNNGTTSGQLISNAVDNNGNSVANEVVQSVAFSRSVSANGTNISYTPWSLDADSTDVPSYNTPIIKGWRYGSNYADSTDSATVNIPGFNLETLNDNFSYIDSLEKASAASAVSDGGTYSDSFTDNNLLTAFYTKDDISQPSTPSDSSKSNNVNQSKSTPISNINSNYDPTNSIYYIPTSNVPAVSYNNTEFSSAVTSSSSSASASSAASSTATQYYEMYNYKTRLVKRSGTIHIFIQPRYTDNDTNGNLKHRDVVMITNENGKVTHDQEVTLDQYNAMLSASDKATFTPEQLQRAYVKRHRKYGIMRDKTHKTTFVSPITKQGNNVLIDTSGEQKGFYSTKDHYLVEDTDDLRVEIPKHINKHHSFKQHHHKNVK